MTFTFTDALISMWLPLLVGAAVATVLHLLRGDVD